VDEDWIANFLPGEREAFVQRLFGRHVSTPVEISPLWPE
jgi:hypothetical protein